MKLLQIPTLFFCVLLTACGGGSSSSTTNNGVNPTTVTNPLPQISAEDPLVFVEGDDLVVIRAASIDIYEAVDNSCSNPGDSQYLGLNAEFQQKTLLCAEFSVTYQSPRELSISRTIDFPSRTADYSVSAEPTPEETARTLSLIAPVFTSSELTGPLPQSFTATMGVFNIQGNLVTLSSTSITINGDLSSTADTAPDGTEISILYSDESVSVFTQYRDLPAGQSFCVDHDKLDENAPDQIPTHIAFAPINTPTDEQYQYGFVFFNREEIESGTYLARVFSMDADGTCLVQGEQAAPAIEYKLTL